MKHFYIFMSLFFLVSCSTDIIFTPQYFAKYEINSSPFRRKTVACLIDENTSKGMQKYYPQSDAGGFRHLKLDINGIANSTLDRVLANFYIKDCLIEATHTLNGDSYKILITKFTYGYEGILSLVPYVEINYTIIYKINKLTGKINSTARSDEKEGYGSANRAAKNFERIIHESLYLDLVQVVRKIQSGV